jgi:PAS domain S-box-containing protein
VSQRLFEDSPEGVRLGVLSGEPAPHGTDRDEIDRAAARFADFSSDLLGISGFDGHVKWVNGAHETLLGYRATELVGRPYSDFVHPGDLEGALAVAAQLANGATDSAEFEARVLAKDGSYRWVAFSAVVSRADALVYSVGKDITDRRKAEQELLLARELAGAIVEAGSFDEALGMVLREVCEQAAWELGQAWIESADGSQLESAAPWHGTSPRVAPFRRLSEAFIFPRGHGLPGKVWADGETVLVRDLASNGDSSRAAFAESVGLGAAVAVPVRAGREVVAVLEFFASELGPEDEGMLGLVSALGAQLGSLVREERAEAARNLSEQHFGAVAQTAADAIVSMGADGRIMYFNEAAERAFGYASSEAAGTAIERLLPSLVEPAGESLEALAGKTLEVTGKQKGGGELSLEAAFSRWSAGGRTFLTIVLRDIAERRHAQEAVREAEERFRGAFEQAPMGMALVSIESDRAGCLLRANNAMRDLTGYSDEDLVGTELSAILDAEDSGADRHYVPWMLAGELSTYEVETRVRRADGRLLDVLLSASLVRDALERPLYLIAQLYDVSARKEAERHVSESRERMQAIIDNTTALIYLKDTEGRYLLVNRVFESVFDVDREAAVGKTDHDLFSDELANLLRANDLRVMREQIPLQVEEVVPQGDHVRTYLSTKFPLLDSSRAPYAVCGIATDITERKQAEEALRASEAHFREIVNTTHEAFVSMDSQGGITAWNPEAETTFGWSEEEALGRNLSDTIIPARYRDGHNRGLEHFRRTGRGALLNRRVEIEALHRDGHEFPVEMTITAVKMGGRFAFNAFLHDISERKQAEQTLRRLADIIESSRDAIVATTPGGEITSWNPGAEQLYGRATRDAIGHRLTELVVPPGASGTLETLDRALSGDRLEDLETEHVRKDGSLVPVSVTVSPMRASTGARIGASVIVRDRTERKRAEEAFREVQEAFRSAFEDAPIGMALFSVDPKDDGRLLQVNRSMCEITGYSSGELLHTSLYAITHSHDYERELTLAEDLLSGETPNYQLEKRYVRANGEVVWVMHNASTVHDSSGRLLYGIAQVQDITKRKRAEESLAKVAGELERRAAELERSNSDLQQFAYVASHDLSEPLRMVSSYVQLLSRRYEGQLDSDADEFIEFAVDGVNRMQRLIEDLLTYSRVGTSDYELAPVDCAALVEDTLGGMRATIADSGAIVTHDDLPTVQGDESQLRQLFQNLISNGIKFVKEDAPRIEVSAERERRAWRFSVADNGIGIDAQHADRIFAVFKRLHSREAYAGSGIGLSICKRIVERHHGRIWVEANDGGGSRFCFTIPDVEPDDSSESEAPKAGRGRMSDSSTGDRSRQKTKDAGGAEAPRED